MMIFLSLFPFVDYRLRTPGFVSKRSPHVASRAKKTRARIRFSDWKLPDIVRGVFNTPVSKLLVGAPWLIPGCWMSEEEEEEEEE